MSMTKTALGAMVLLCLASEAPGTLAEPAAQAAVHRVITLNSTDPLLPAYIALDSAVQASVREGSGVPVEFYEESLDVRRFEQAGLEDKLVALLRTKYRDLRVEVVVAYATAALQFAQRYRDDIWPGAAIVFNSVAGDVLARSDPSGQTAGVLSSLHFGETIELALALRPTARHLVVIAGTAEADRRFAAQVEGALASIGKDLAVDYLVGLTVAQTIAAVRALPQDAVVLFTTMFRDGTGAPQVPVEVLEKIAAASPVPVFGLHETYLGHGITAGMIASYAAQGRRTGEIVNRILAGEAPSDIGVLAPTAAHCMADWKQLVSWEIDESLLPGDCDVRFTEESIWHQYRWQIFTAFAVMLAQLALIAMLVFSRRTLARAQRDLGAELVLRREIESNAATQQARLTRFARERSLGVMATSIVHEVSQPLIAIQNYAQAARRRLRGGSDDAPKVDELLGKIQGQAERAGSITQRVRSLVNNREVRLVPTSLATLIDEVIPMLQSEYEALGCRVRSQQANELPLVMADPLQIQLVLVNLLSNALRSMHTAGAGGGVILVDTKLVEGQMVQVSVTDEGSGLAPERAQAVFEPLYSSDRSGMGVGLAICQEIISLHGGRIWYEPNPAGGAIFRFTLKRSDT